MTSVPRALRAFAAACTLGVIGARSGAAQVTTLRGLAFGTVISGTSTSIAPTAAGAMSLKIHGTLVAAGIVSFTLPTTLARTGGGTAMPVSFCSTCAVYRVNNSNPAGGSAFNPNSAIAGLIVAVAADVYIWLGGKVSPPLNQPAGSYSGTVVMTVSLLL